MSRLNKGWKKSNTANRVCTCSDCNRVYGENSLVYDIWVNKENEVLCLSCYRNIVSEEKGISN